MWSLQPGWLRFFFLLPSLLAISLCYLRGLSEIYCRLFSAFCHRACRNALARNEWHVCCWLMSSFGVRLHGIPIIIQWWRLAWHMLSVFIHLSLNHISIQYSALSFHCVLFPAAGFLSVDSKSDTIGYSHLTSCHLASFMHVLNR